MISSESSPQQEDLNPYPLVDGVAVTIFGSVMINRVSTEVGWCTSVMWPLRGSNHHSCEYFEASFSGRSRGCRHTLRLRSLKCAEYVREKQ